MLVHAHYPRYARGVSRSQAKFKTLSEKNKRKKKKKKDWGMAQVVEYVTSNHEALSLKQKTHYQ
jgi:hypothetical protein